MPIPTAASKVKEGGGGDVDTSQLSAYAVYNNLVPGVKAYQDTSESTPASARRKSKKKANKKAAADAAVKNELSKLMESGQGKGTKSARGQGQSATSNGQTPGAERNRTKAKVALVAAPEISPGKQSKRKNKNLLNGASGNQPQIQPEPESPGTTPTAHKNRSRKRSKLNKKNKKRKSEEAEAVVPSGSEAAVIEETPPPKKVRKLNQEKSQESKFLPNPLASRNANTTGYGAIKNGGTVDEQAGTSKRKKKNQGNESSPKQASFDEPDEPIVAKTRKGRKAKNSLAISNSSINEVQIIEEDAEEAVAVSLPHTQKKNKKNKAAKVSEPDPTGFEDSADLPNVFDIINAKPVQDSISHGESLFKWLVHPQPVSVFKSEFWEKAPLLIKRNDVFPEYYEWLLSTAALDDMLRKNVLKYSENVDITAYEDGVRDTISKELSGRARPAAVWDYYATGHSVRILNPQTYCKPLWRLNAALQEWFGCFVGANVYLTPPDSQGFAPHYDDIEAFILQVEGKKHWKVYKPRSPNSELPRFSSQDFKEDDDLGELVMDVILEEGDLLYFPRGWIHQAKTVDGYHSMHITLSCFQQNTWADLMKQHFVKALEKLTTNDISFRRGLPTDYMSFMGIAHSSNRDKDIVSKRKEFKKTLKNLLEKVMEEEADEAADEMGKKFIWDSLPPYLSRREKDITVNEDGEFLNQGRVKNRVEMDPDVEVKLLRKNCIRLMTEENTLRLYFSIENSLVYHVEEPQFIEVPEEFRPAIEHLIKKYPEFTRIEDLPMEADDITKKIQLIADFWEKGIVMTKKPLEAGEIDDEDFDFDADDGEEILDDEDDEDDYDDVEDDSCSDEDDDQSDEGSFIDDSSADMDEEIGEFMSDDDNLNIEVNEDEDNSNVEEEEDDSNDDIEVLELDGAEEETDEDDVGFEDD